MSTNTVLATLHPSLLIPGSFTVRIPVYYQETYTISVFSSISSTNALSTVVVNFSSGLPTLSPLPVLSRSISGLVPGSVYYVRILQSNLASGQSPFAGYVKMATQMAIPTISAVARSTTSAAEIDVSFPRHPQDTGDFKYRLQAFVVSTRNGQTVISQTPAHTGTEASFLNNVTGTSLMKISASSNLTAGSTYQMRLVVTDGANQVVWNTTPASGASSGLLTGASGTTTQSSLVTPFISNYVNSSTNIMAPYQISFPSSPAPVVTLPYSTNTIASTSITLTSFPAPSVIAPSQEYVVYALDTSLSPQPTLIQLQAAQSGTFSAPFTQDIFDALPKSASTTSRTNVTVQGLEVTKSYKFAVIARSSVSAGYIVGGFIDNTTTLTGINASTRAVYVSKSFASNKFTLRYSFVDSGNTYTTAPSVQVTATRVGDNSAPITVSSLSPLLVATSTSQNLDFEFPVSSSESATSLLQGAFYNFVASVSGGRIGETGNPLTGGSSVIGSVSVSTSLLAPCPQLAPTLTVQNSSTSGSIDFTIEDATPGLETTVSYTLYFSTSSTASSPTVLPQTDLKRGITNTFPIANLTGLTASTSYFFFVKYTSGSQNTYSTTTAPFSVASSSPFLVPVSLPVVSAITFSDPTVVNAISLGFNSDLTGRLTADSAAITLAESNYIAFVNTSLGQASPVPWLLSTNLPYLSSHLTNTILNSKSPATSAFILATQQTLAQQTVSTTIVSTFVTKVRDQLLANLNVWTAYETLRVANLSLVTSTSSTNVDTSGLWLFNRMVNSLVISLTSGVITDNQPFYQTPAQIMSSLATSNTTNAFQGMNNTIYQALLSKQASSSPHTTTVSMLDQVRDLLIGTSAPSFNTPLANYALVRSAILALVQSVANSATPVAEFNTASSALTTALNGASPSAADFKRDVEIHYLMTIMYNVAITPEPRPTTSNWFLTPGLPSLSTIVNAVNTAYATAATNLIPTYQVQLSTAFATPQTASLINVSTSNIVPVYTSSAPPSGTTNDSSIQRRTGISGFNVVNWSTSLVAGQSYFARVSRTIPTGFAGAFVPSGGNSVTSLQRAIPSIQALAPTNVTVQPSTSAEGHVIVNYVANASAGSNAQYTVRLTNQSTSPHQTSTYVSSSSASCAISGLVVGNNFVASVSTNATPGVYTGTFVAPRIASPPSAASAVFMAPMRVPAPIQLVEAVSSSTTGIKAYTYNSYLPSATTPNQITIVFNPNWTSVPRQSDLANQSYNATFTGLVNPTTTLVPVEIINRSSCVELQGGNLKWTYTIPSSWFVNGSNTRRTLTEIRISPRPQTSLNYLAAPSNSELVISVSANPPSTVPPASSISVTSLEIISGIVHFDFVVPSSLVAADNALYPEDAFHPLNAETNGYWSGPQSFTLSLLNQTAQNAAPLVFNTAQTTVTQGIPPSVSTGSLISKTTTTINGISHAVFSGSFPSSTPLLGGNNYLLRVELDESFGNLAPLPIVNTTMSITGIAQLQAPSSVEVVNIPGKAGAISVSWLVPSVSNQYQILVSSQNGDYQNCFNSLVPGENGLVLVPGTSSTYKYDIFLYGSTNGATPSIPINANNPLTIQVINMPVQQSDIQSFPTTISNIVPLLLLSKPSLLTALYDDATPKFSFKPPSEADGTLSFSYKVIVRETATSSDIFSSIFSSNNSTDSSVDVYILGQNGRGLLQRGQTYEYVVIANYNGSDKPVEVVANSSYTNSWITTSA